MSDYQAFLQAIAREPHDWWNRRVFADWLMEHGDPRGEMLHLLYDLLQLDCEDRTSKQAQYLKLYHEGLTVPHLTREDNGMEVRFVLLPPGQFLMGSPKSETGRYDDEDQVEVTLTGGFWIGQTVVTQSQWEEVMGTRPWEGEPYTRTGANDPATYVNHEDATNFCERLTERDQKAGHISPDWEYRLPTEAQWEYACRAGTRTRYSFGDDESQLGDYAWYSRNAYNLGERYAHEVGQKKGNPWELYDMHGNVWEWCQDCWNDDLPGGVDPVVTEESGNRVLRGGGWGSDSGYCRSANRASSAPENRGSYLGFRLAAVQSIH